MNSATTSLDGDDYDLEDVQEVQEGKKPRKSAAGRKLMRWNRKTLELDAFP